MNPDPFLNRRGFLVGAASSCFPALVRADDLDAIHAQAVKAKLPAFKRSQTKHFRGIGDAAPAYQTEALSAAETIAAEFVAHFQEKGFKVPLPKDPMTVVILASPASYAAFTGEPLETIVGGQYDVDTARLVVFDFRAGGRSINAQAEVINSRTLAHETVHQLSYATGMLSARSDIPACINEGIGTYGETWRPRGRGKIGQVNQGWLDMLRSAGASERWLPLAKLVGSDKSFEDPDAATQCYAQSWLLVHYALKTKTMLPRFVAYLDHLKTARDARTRLDDFRKHLGPTEKLEMELRRYVRHPIGT